MHGTRTLGMLLRCLSNIDEEVRVCVGMGMGMCLGAWCMHG